MIDTLAQFHYVLIAAVVLVAGLFKGAFGFGMASIATPFLALFLEPRFAVQFMVVPTLAGDLLGLLTSRMKFRLDRSVWVFLATICIGAVAGARMLLWLPNQAIGLVVGLVTTGVAVLRLSGLALELSPRAAAISSAPVGMVTGLIIGATGMGAPLTALYLSTLSLPRESMIMTLNLIFVVTSTVRVFSSGLGSVWVDSGVQVQLFIIAFIVTGVVSGAWLRHHSKPASFDKGLNIFFLVMGLVLTGRALLS